MICHFSRIPITSRCGKSIFFILFMCCLLFPFIVSADPDSMEYRAEAYRTYQSIEIDGEFNEEDWQNAKTITRLVQYEPAEGELISQPTEIRILYDAKEIYFGFTCFDTDIPKMVANEMRRDGSGQDGLRENDHVSILLDTYNDRRNGFFFRVNPLGAMEDMALINSGESRNQAWDAIWTCRTKINENHWTAEIGIPFSQLRFSKSDDMTWGLNLGRSLMRNQEDATWAPLSKAHGFFARYRTDVIGNLVGLEGITPSRNLELLPYVLPKASRIEADNDTDGELELGFDVKYGLTSNLTADLTFNTDFAQVEADQEQVNLTRFSLFFPEKRPFFLEGAGLFDFGIPRTSFRRPPPLLLFYSRRIGLEEGRAIPIITGGKITGKMGPYGVGMLNVLTNEFHDETDPDDIVDVPHTNYSVLRLTRDLFSGSRIGLIGINKQDGDAYNRAGGFDFSYRPVDNFDVRGLWAYTSDSDEADGSGNAWYIGSSWRNDRFRLGGSYTDIGEDFNPKVGYIRREGVRQIRSDIRYTPWLRKFGIRRIWTGPEFDLVLNRDGGLETRSIRFSNWFELERGGRLQFEIRQTAEHLDEDFEVRDDIIIPIDEYNFTSARAGIQTDESKMLAGEFDVNFGEFYNGNRRGFDIGTTFKPSGRFALESQYQFNRISLPGEEPFNVNVFGGRFAYSFSTQLFAKLFAQWNSDDNVISTNFLLNYIYRPGSDFYLVFNQIYDSNGGGVDLAESTLVGKLTYWWNP
jgi:hypothetical protein